VLLVEDEGQILTLAESVLREGGYNTMTASTAAARAICTPPSDGAASVVAPASTIPFASLKLILNTMSISLQRP
jgi:CheY-like chemotaxis protein